MVRDCTLIPARTADLILIHVVSVKTWDVEDLTTIYLVRHGETEGNASNLAQGFSDVPLNEKGRAQAKLVGERLKNWHLNAIYSSDSQRALQTAEPLLKLRPDFEIETTPDLREKNYGICENYSWKQIQDEYPELFAQMLNLETGSDTKFPGGESDREQSDRVAKFTEKIIAQHDDDDAILFFGHGGSIRSAAAYLCKFRLEDKWRLQTDNASISAISSAPTWRDDGWRIERWNDTYHLNGFDSHG